MKLALVHDYLSQNGGAEKVLEAMQEIWPQAPIHTLFFDRQKIPHFADKDVRTSFLQRLPFSRSHYKWYLALMPTATEQFDFSGFDVVLSSCSAFSKGVITRPEALHICYCHTPTRYLWSDAHEYLRELNLPGFIKHGLRPLLSYLRLWDRQAAERVDLFLANSQTVRARIKKYYHKDSLVLPPPVETEKFYISTAPKNYFLAGGRLVAYKRFDLIVEACQKTQLPLKIFGVGPAEARLRALAGPQTEFLGPISENEKIKLFAEARAFIHPQEEDFGITPVEAMASGRPVIAYKKGGACETVMA